MPVQLTLNSDQREVFELAVKKKNIANLNTLSRYVHVTADNLQPIYEAVEALHIRNMKIKAKTIVHLHNCYQAEQIMLKLNALLPEFPGVTLTGANDADIGVVEPIEEESDAPTIEGAADSERLATLAASAPVMLEADGQEINLSLNTKEDNVNE